MLHVNMDGIKTQKPIQRMMETEIRIVFEVDEQETEISIYVPDGMNPTEEKLEQMVLSAIERRRIGLQNSLEVIGKDLDIFQEIEKMNNNVW